MREEIKIVEQIIELEKQIQNLSIEWCEKILENKDELESMEKTRQMLVDLDEEYQNNKKRAEKLKSKISEII